jgi:hypothetical protein
MAAADNFFRRAHEKLQRHPARADTSACVLPPAFHAHHHPLRGVGSKMGRFFRHHFHREQLTSPTFEREPSGR